jgi:hypothetical protein
MKGHELSATERAEIEMADAKRSKPREDSRPAPCSAPVTVERFLTIVEDCARRGLAAMDNNQRGICRKQLKSIRNIAARFKEHNSGLRNPDAT